MLEGKAAARSSRSKTAHASTAVLPASNREKQHQDKQEEARPSQMNENSTSTGARARVMFLFCEQAG